MTAEQQARDMIERITGMEEAQQLTAGDVVELANLIADRGCVWQPIETAPRDGTEVLVCRVYEDGKAEYAVAHNYDDGNGWRDMGDLGWAGMTHEEDNQPTHWMPLPTPPSANDAGNRPPGIVPESPRLTYDKARHSAAE